MLVTHEFAERKSEYTYVQVAIPVGEIQLKMYCDPSPYHEKQVLYKRYIWVQ
jgi:hypothetical protein